MQDAAEFLRRVDRKDMGAIDRAVALLWYAGRDDSSAGLSTGQICRAIESAGHAQQNVTRLRVALGRLKAKTIRVPGKNDCWRLGPHHRAEITPLFSPFVEGPIVPPASDSVLPRSLFRATRTYIERTVQQINASYDAGLFDCTAVMCRRLLETLIIETYESVGRGEEIKGADGHFQMFAGLLGTLEKDSAFSVSRNGLQGLRDFKKLGDLSAHNRRFNARREDIDRVRDGLRVASEELLHLAKLI